jgi:hypothetical protein
MNRNRDQPEGDAFLTLSPTARNRLKKSFKWVGTKSLPNGRRRWLAGRLLAASLALEQDAGWFVLDIRATLGVFTMTPAGEKVIRRADGHLLLIKVGSR